jgi:hypothetical protein
MDLPTLAEMAALASLALVTVFLLWMWREDAPKKK